MPTHTYIHAYVCKHLHAHAYYYVFMYVHACSYLPEKFWKFTASNTNEPLITA